jgi:hypothetical protein
MKLSTTHEADNMFLTTQKLCMGFHGATLELMPLMTRALSLQSMGPCMMLVMSRAASTSELTDTKTNDFNTAAPQFTLNAFICSYTTSRGPTGDFACRVEE